MNRSVIVMDTPARCYDCPCCATEDNWSVCQAISLEECHERNIGDDGTILPDCPLKPLPVPQIVNEYDFQTYSNGVNIGWNRCLEKITGEVTWTK